MEQTVCSICHVDAPKYICPSCGVRTCSLNCVKRHKRQTECTGERDQSRFIPKEKLTKDEHNVNRDYNFLLNLGRKIEVSKQDLSKTAKNVMKRAKRNGPNNPNKRQNRLRLFPNNGLMPLIEERFSDLSNISIKRKDTILIHLPPGMSRSLSNKTGYDKKSGSFIWTIEWIFVNKEGDVSNLTSYRINEGMSLREAFPLHVAIPQGESGTGVGKGDLHFYLKNVLDIRQGTHSVIEINGDETISDALSDKVVIEYPTVYVSVGSISLGDSKVTVSKSYIRENGLKEDNEHLNDEGGQSTSSESSSSQSESDESSEDTSEDSESDEETGDENPNHQDSGDTKNFEQKSYERKHSCSVYDDNSTSQYS